MEVGIKLKVLVQSDKACEKLGLNPYCVKEGSDGEELIIVNLDDAIGWGLIKSSEEEKVSNEEQKVSNEEQKVSNEELRQHIFNVVSDLVGSFMFYDRKECEYLPSGAIEKAVENGIITHDEIIKKFAEELKS